MAIKLLPEAITKDILFEEAQKRFAYWAKLYGDSDISLQYMYEDMACSIFSGDPEADFPEIVGPKKEDTIRYQYNKGSCYFTIDGIVIEVLDCREMRKDPEVHTEKYSDVCVLSISYTDDDGNYMCHIIPNAWLYGSTGEGFNEDKPVHEEFLDAAHEYIKEHNITKEMQEVQD